MARTQDTSSLIIKRTAVDFSGRLASLYDGCQDQVVGTLNATFEKSSDQFRQLAQCILVKGNPNQSQNLLELIDIDEQLRLSLLLRLTSKHGIGAVIDHPHLINEYTRIFRYTYIHREERFPDETQNIGQWLPTLMPETNATHVITGISWGVDIIIILQLPPENDIVTMIDLTLEKYRAYLNDDSNEFKRTRDDIYSTKKILDTQVYSNISDLTKITAFHDLFHNISRFKMDDTKHERLTYTLYPIQSLYSQNPMSNYVYIPLDSINNTKLQQYLFELLTSMKTLQSYFNKNIPNLLCGHFKERFLNTLKQWSIVNNDYNNIIEQFSMLIIEVRCGLVPISTLDKKLQSKLQIDSKSKIDKLTQDVVDLLEKGHLISDLSYQQIEYCDVKERGVNKTDHVDTLKHKLIGENNDLVLCSSDLLNQNNPALLKELRHTLLEELKNNPKLHIIYADFSYCDYALDNMMILPSTKDFHIKNSNEKEILTSLPTKTSTSIPQSSSRLLTTETITVLLLGETGVGKSTFINALANYLTFKTFDNAQSNKPIITIPVSFLITVSGNSDVYSVKYSNLNNSKNEDFNHPGQSVTQHCKSYTYNLNERRKLRIIDVPGFGDIRGLNQDDRNMEHILNYIKKFTHLNAICFLFKSNESKLNIFFRSCLTQLFNLFGPNICNNIIFCFTHTRSTFYTPGNTSSILKNMFSSFIIRDIPFKKKNIFCFDSESFRYLVALQNNIPFTDHDKQVYEMSWTNSVIESNRLIRYIRKKLIPCPIPNEDEAIKRAEIKIVHLTRPMIEIMRYILRNIIITKMKSLKLTIDLHEMDNDDYHFQHLPHQPITLEFLQDYRIGNDSLLRSKQDDMIDHLSLFCHISVELGDFLMHVARYRNGDPFLTGLLRLISEENDICEKQNRNYINLQLVDGLKKLASNYEQRIRIIKSNPKHITLTDIFQWIRYISEYPLVSEYVIDNCRVNVKDDYKISTI